VVTGKVVEKQGRLIVDDLVNNRPTADSFEAELPGLSVGSDYDDPDNPEGGYDVTSISPTPVEVRAVQVETCSGSRRVIIRKGATDLHYASAGAAQPSAGELDVADAGDTSKRVLFRFSAGRIEIDEDDNGSFETTLSSLAQLTTDELCRETGAR